MDTIDGEWIMKGCRRTDPDCLHSPEDLLEMIREVGFLPLFSNDIPLFCQLPPGRLRLRRYV